MYKRKNEIIECYLGRIREEIYNLTPVDDFIDNLRQDLYEYEENNPDLTEDDLESEFGIPEEIAKDFLAENEVIKPKQVAQDKKLRNTIIILLILLIIAGGIYVADMISHTQTMATDVIIIEE